MQGNRLNGATINIPYATYDNGGNPDPDPAQVALCRFAGIENNFGQGAALDNRNYLGFNGCHIDIMRAIETIRGAWYGFGTANILDVASVASCKNYAFNDGTGVDHVAGAPLRIIVHQAEIDNCENGIYLNTTHQCDFKQIRFNHRYQTNLNTSANYWPRNAIMLAAGATASVSDIDIRAIQRIEAGGTKADLGNFLNGVNSQQIVRADVRQEIQDNPGFGFTNSDYYTGINVNAKIKLWGRSSIILNQLDNA